MYHGPLSRYEALPEAEAWASWLRPRLKSRRRPLIGGKVLALSIALHSDNGGMAWRTRDDLEIAAFFGCSRAALTAAVKQTMRLGLLIERFEPLYVERLLAPIIERFLEPSEEVMLAAPTIWDWEP